MSDGWPPSNPQFPRKKNPLPAVGAGVGGVLVFLGCGALVLLIAGVVVIYVTCSHMGPIE